MEKLIELLNEYLKTFDTETNKTVKPFAFEEATKCFIANNGISYRQERVISKRFKFIKWLVENNKIDIFKSGIDELPRMFGYDYESVECKSDRLVMMLSIQNNPIEYLVSILE